ncbi:MAG: MarC family protein [Victivallales bacterium]|nr:MarC family protein [Victivallales bacterium]
MKLFIRFFFLLTPFFVTSMMLTATPDWPARSRRKLAFLIGFSGLLICYTLLFFGRFIFDAFGITVDAFRIGGGLLLLLSGITLVNGKSTAPPKQLHSPPAKFSDEKISNIAVVPLAMPVMIGPGTSAALLIQGSQLQTFMDYLHTIAAVSAAIFAVFIILFLATWLEKKLGHQGLAILSKLTGLVLSALGAQLMVDGINNLIVLPALLKLTAGA